MTYFEKIQLATQAIIEELRSRGVKDEYLTFGGAGKRTGKLFIPTDSRSEFLANRAMGDWAETTLSKAIEAAFPDRKVVQYGFTDRIAAGDEGFRESYEKKVYDVDHYGKRPDLLIMNRSVDCPSDVSELPTKELMPIVTRADYAIEVRSSKFEALRYMKIRGEDKLAGKKGVRDTPSFTVKIEDLKIVYRWLEQHSCSQIYCQVFFDSMFAINFLSIFSIIGSGRGFTIENPKKSQEKATIMIPITSGKQIAHCTLPEFTVEHRVTRLGRHDAFVKPVGGSVEINQGALLEAASAA